MKGLSEIDIQEHYIPEPNSGCWLWHGSTFRLGYGRIRRHGKHWLAHRVMWAARHGPVPDGLNVLHRCDTPCCVNPDHLFLGTRADNNADRDKKGRHAALKGEANGFAKLTVEQVQAIRADPRTGPAIARDYGVTAALVSLIKRKEAWRHIT